MKRLLKLTGFGSLLLLACALGWVLYKEPVFRAYLCPSCFGLTEIELQIYLEASDDVAQAKIHADVLQAQRNIEAFSDRPFRFRQC